MDIQWMDKAHYLTKSNEIKLDIEDDGCRHNKNVFVGFLKSL